MGLHRTTIVPLAGCLLAALVLVRCAEGQARSAKPVAGHKRASGELSLAHVPASAVAIFAARPAKLLDGTQKKTLERLLSQVASISADLIARDDIGQLVGVATAPKVAGDDGGATNAAPPARVGFNTVIIHFDSAQDWGKKLKVLGDQLKPAQHKDTKYFVTRSTEDLAFWPIDARQCAIAPRATLIEMIEQQRKRVKAPTWTEGWSQIAHGDLALATDPSWMQSQMVRPGGAQNEQMAFTLMANLFRDTNSLVVGFSNDDQVTGKIVVACVDAEDAGVRVEAFQSMFALARTMQQQAKAAGQLGQAAQDALRVAEQFSDGVEITQHEHLVLVSLRSTASATEMMPLLLGALDQLTGGPAPTKAPAATSPPTARAAKPLKRGMADNPVLAARRESSMEKLTRVATAIRQYEETNGCLPPRAICDSRGRALLSWRVALLPQLGEEELYAQFHLDEPWNSDHNRALLAKMPELYSGPTLSDLRRPSTVAAVYAMAGRDTCFPLSGSVRREQITDGAENTLMLIEARRSVPWTKPEEITVQDDGALRGKLGGFDPSGFLAVFADGEVTFLTYRKVSDSLPALTTISGGEALRRDDLGAESPADAATEAGSPDDQ